MVDWQVGLLTSVGMAVHFRDGGDVQLDTADLQPLQELIRRRRVDAVLLPTHRATLENFVMEERVQPLRQQAFATAIGSGSWLDVDALAAAHRNFYLHERIDLEHSDPAVPDTFDAHLNGSNVWSGIEENLALYRLEAVSFALKGSGVDETDLEHAVVGRNRTGATPAQVNAADTVLERLCDAWNLGRHRRPAFATTEPEIDHLLHDPGDDWPHALRDHLGLGHLSPLATSAPIQVLLMRYTVKEVRDAATKVGHGGFCIPTVLDGPINPYFFPTPLPSATAPAAPQRCGGALNLRASATQSDYAMGLELIHSFVAYRPEHVVRWGLVSRPLAVDLPVLRGYHLDWLRLDTERDDFGCNLDDV